jgi:hypothetical protein
MYAVKMYLWVIRDASLSKIGRQGALATAWTLGGRSGTGVGPSGRRQEPPAPVDGPGVEATRGHARSGLSRALGTSRAVRKEFPAAGPRL